MTDIARACSMRSTPIFARFGSDRRGGSSGRAHEGAKPRPRTANAACATRAEGSIEGSGDLAVLGSIETTSTAGTWRVKGKKLSLSRTGSRRATPDRQDEGRQPIWPTSAEHCDLDSRRGGRQPDTRPTRRHVYLETTLAAAKANRRGGGRGIDGDPVTDKALSLDGRRRFDWKTRISSPQKGFARWHGDGAARRAVTNTGPGCYRRFAIGSSSSCAPASSAPLRTTSIEAMRNRLAGRERAQAIPASSPATI